MGFIGFLISPLAAVVAAPFPIKYKKYLTDVQKVVIEVQNSSSWGKKMNRAVCKQNNWWWQAVKEGHVHR
jgi:hypothetical protein